MKMIKVMSKKLVRKAIEMIRELAEDDDDEEEDDDEDEDDEAEEEFDDDEEGQDTEDRYE